MSTLPAKDLPPSLPQLNIKRFRMTTAMLSWMILATLVGSVVIGVAIRGMAVSGLMVPMTILGIVGIAAIHFRHEDNFTLCLGTLAQISLFSMAFVVLTYLGAEIARPLCDKQLAAWDAALGFHLPTVRNWLSGHPWIQQVLQWSYDSLLPQTAIIVAVLGFRGERKPLETFILRMMIAALVAFIFFLWMPAEGTFCDFGRTPTGWEVHYLQHFRALRAGQFQAFNFAEAEGLITFPSFHVVWALLIFMAVRQHRILRWLFAVVEAAVIVSAITAGGHYLVDLFAGALLTAAVCWITAEKQSDYPPDIQEKIASNSSR